MEKPEICIGIKRLFVSKDIRYKEDVLMGENMSETKRKLKNIYHIKIKEILQANECNSRLGHYVFYR